MHIDMEETVHPIKNFQCDIVTESNSKAWYNITIENNDFYFKEETICQL